VISEQGAALAGVSVAVKGTIAATTTNHPGRLLHSRHGRSGAAVSAHWDGARRAARSGVGGRDQTCSCAEVALDLDAVVVTALGIKRAGALRDDPRSRTVPGDVIVQAQRGEFRQTRSRGALRVWTWTSTSGVPGASSSITIRGITSISGSNQPLIIVDGLPMDNRTLNTGVLASRREFEYRALESHRLISRTARPISIRTISRR